MPYGSRYRRATRRTGGFRRRVTRGNTKAPVKKIVRRYNNKLFKARVQRVLRSSIERKMKVWNIFNDISPHGTGLVKGDPSTQRGVLHSNLLGTSALGGVNLVRGTNQEQFVGNRIENCKLRVRGFVKSLPYDGSSNTSTFPFEITVLFYKNKTTPAADPNSIKVYPNNTNDKINSLQATLYPWNRDEYVIFKTHTVRLRALPKEMTDDDAIINSTIASGTAYRRFSYSIPIKKTLMIPDLEVAPTNEWVGCSAYITNGDGTSYGAATRRASIYMDGILTWTDA